MLIVFSTAPNQEEAKSLAEQAVEKKLAACVQIIPGMTSVYEWKGEVAVDDEVLLLFKTNEKTYPRLKEMIETSHSYDVPEIVAVESKDVAGSYLEWLEASLGQ